MFENFMVEGSLRVYEGFTELHWGLTEAPPPVVLGPFGLSPNEGLKRV